MKEDRQGQEKDGNMGLEERQQILRKETLFVWSLLLNLSDLVGPARDFQIQAGIVWHNW